jgi:hypothetical protein
MSEHYARFVQAVAGAARDEAMENMLEENESCAPCYRRIKSCSKSSPILIIIWDLNWKALET